MTGFNCIEICAGAGGQALGLEIAGFKHTALIEIDKNACATLRHNRPNWNIHEVDVRAYSYNSISQVDLFAAGVPCPPFSIAGKQKGKNDDRDLFPEALRLIEECRPKAVLLENVKGLLSKKFDSYVRSLNENLKRLGYDGEWKIIMASDYNVPQLRPRAVFVGFKDDYWKYFKWPEKKSNPPTVGDTLYEEMISRGWKNARKWKEIANTIAPTLVGGSKKHGGADLGPTRSKQAWKKLGIDGKGLSEDPPSKEFDGMPRLTVKMTSLIQGFPKDWEFMGKKTPAYRQVGNAFPPPVASAIGECIMSALKYGDNKCQKEKALEINFASTF